MTGTPNNTDVNIQCEISPQDTCSESNSGWPGRENKLTDGWQEIEDPGVREITLKH